MKLFTFAFSFLVAFIIGCLKPECPTSEPPFVLVISAADGGGVPDSGFVFDEPYDTPAGYSQPGCAAACANLKLRGCPEGQTRPGEDSCYTVCSRGEATRVIDFKTACIARERTREGIRRCGSYQCKDR